MNILYFSVHAILEYDEVRLLRALGHNVVSLGVYFDDVPLQTFRPPLPLSPEERALRDTMAATGSRHAYGAPASEQVLTTPFVAQFDCVVVMHDLDTIVANWEALRVRPVIWRTIGQNIEPYEAMAGPLRTQGLRIVRYSAAEGRVAGYAGHDAVIPFAKDPAELDGWTGDSGRILTFAHFYRSRYPDDVVFYEEAVTDLPADLGGAGNEVMAQTIGLADPEAQIALYRRAGAYFYASGRYLPYTLNFIEAWMMGVPVVAFDPDRPRNPIYDIPRLIEDGVDGFVVRSPAEARERLAALLNDPALARRVGGAGRAAAISVFGPAVARRLWRGVVEAADRNRQSTEFG